MDKEDKGIPFCFLNYKNKWMVIFIYSTFSKPYWVPVRDYLRYWEWDRGLEESSKILNDYNVE